MSLHLGCIYGLVEREEWEKREEDGEHSYQRAIDLAPWHMGTLRRRRGGGGLFLTRVQRSVCGMEELHLIWNINFKSVNISVVSA